MIQRCNPEGLTCLILKLREFIGFIFAQLLDLQWPGNYFAMMTPFYR